MLLEEGLLSRREIAHPPAFPQTRVNYGKCERYKMGLFQRAFENFTPGTEYRRFWAKNKDWLDDFSLFAALKEHFGVL